MPTVHLLIKGKVQGVFYRATAKEKAIQLGIKGWIKNTQQGNVETVITGTEEMVLTFVDWCKVGPSHAVVTSVEITPIEDKVFDGFRITRD